MGLLFLFLFSEVNFSTNRKHHYYSAKPLHCGKFVVKHKRAHQNAQAFTACCDNRKLVVVKQADCQENKNLAHRSK